MAVSRARVDAMEAFLDAAERLLITEGYAGVSVRRLAEEAGANHGLVHYYFGSMEELFLRVLERFTDRLIERQRAMYAADVPFIEKWRAAMRYLDEDLEAGYPKIWFELQAMAWNHPEMRERIVRVNAEWREVLTEAFTAGDGRVRPRPRAGSPCRRSCRWSSRSTRGSCSSACRASRPATRAARRDRRGGSKRSSRRRSVAMRARLPDHDGYVERDGVKVFYEVFAERGADRADARCSCRRGRSSTPGTGRRRCPT